MPTRPLSPEGGSAEKVLGVFPRGSKARIDRLAASRGMSRAAYLRYATTILMEADEAAQEVSSRAS